MRVAAISASMRCPYEAGMVLSSRVRSPSSVRQEELGPKGVSESEVPARLPTSRRCFVPRSLKTLLLVGSIAFVPSQAFPQMSASTAEANLATPAGHEVNFGVEGYEYVERGDTSISIHGDRKSVV